MTKKALAIELSRLRVFEHPKTNLEQYPTDSEIAAEILWNAYMKGDIKGKVIADLGAGTGILGMGALLLGAKRVIFEDIDPDALKVARENKALIEQENSVRFDADFQAGDVIEFDEDVDIVIMNPPFGAQNTKADTMFLEKAMQAADVIYTFHKASTKEYINSYAASNGYETTDYWEFDWPLKNTMAHHTKRIERIKVGGWRLEKKGALED
ncbi:methyltransferase [Candidatus Woesearchaeota archaeon]|nr:methyltransferase [Candidatus Woesearchaeota archaeon]